MPKLSTALLLGLLVSGQALAQAHQRQRPRPVTPATEPAPEPPEGVDPSQVPLEGAEHAGQSPADLARKAMGHVPRDASGTAWQPDSSPVHALTFSARGWSFLIHFNALGGYDAQTSPRGGHQLFSANWLGLTLNRRIQGGDLFARVMLSAEPASIGPGGYPLLLQSGESNLGLPLVDRQHPQGVFMEVALLYRHLLAGDLGLAFYAAPAGEPALGPVAFPHRLSAMVDPFAPLGHHWQDSTHTSFGVFTAGVYTRLWKLEASWFNGREPGEDRWSITLGSLDSLSARFSLNPTENLSAQVSYGYLRNPEALSPGAVQRLTASVTHNLPLGEGNWATTAVWGHNLHQGQGNSDSLLLETALELGRHHVLFGRAESVVKDARALALPAGDGPAPRYTLGALSLGYLYQFALAGQLQLGVGAAGTVDVVPGALEPLYGRFPLGGMVYLRLGLAPAPREARAGVPRAAAAGGAPAQAPRLLSVEAPRQAPQ